MDYRDRYIASLEDQIEMLKTTLQLQAEKLKNLEEKSVFEDKSVSEQIPTPTVPKVQKKREKILKISEVGPACDGCRVHWFS